MSKQFSPVREHQKSPVNEILVTQVRLEYSSLTALLKGQASTGKKRQSEINDHDKRERKLKYSNEVFNQ